MEAEQFIQQLHTTARLRQLSGASSRVLLYMVARAGARSWNIKRAAIAADLGVSEASVSRAFARFDKLGIDVVRLEMSQKGQ
jgi:hypothetical protein